MLPPPSSQSEAVPSAPPAAGRVRIGLLLPLRAPGLKAAAEMVRDGFMAAHERDGANVDLTLIETDDVAGDVSAAYRDAATRYDLVVGPLTRSAVGAVASGGAVSRPTIALAQPDPAADGSLRLPAKLLAIGLSIEDEARQAARWADRQHGGRKALILSTNVTWQKRAARAFVNQWQHDGIVADMLELAASNGVIDGAALAQLKKRLHGDPPALVFVALDAPQAGQVRAVIGPELPLYGTSQLNTLNLAEIAGAEKQPALDGVHLVDLPWQLQPDHPAVMVYPHPLTIGVQRRSPDMERLYALGIDAFRIAAEIGAGRSAFIIDGVTGRLSVQFDGIHPALFERIEPQATVTGGVATPSASAP